MSRALEINREYYGTLSAGRENYWKLMPAPRMRIERVLSAIRLVKPSPSACCDFGCGNGALLAAVRERFPHASSYGIDLSAAQIAENAEAQVWGQWACADLTADEFRYPFAEPCEVAISSEVIEHVDRPEAYLRNILAGLRPGGLLVLTTQSGPVHSTERLVGHVRHWEPAEMESLLEAAGFQSAVVTNCGFPFHDLSKWAANVRPSLTVRRFGEREWGPAERAVAGVLRTLFRFNSMRRGYQLVARASK
jgi:SAM-dependent methyltransferase